MNKRNLMLLTLISTLLLSCNNSTRPEFSQIDSYSCDCQDDPTSYEPVNFKCNVSILGEDGLVSHTIEVRKGENITGKIKTEDKRAQMYDDHPTQLYKIENGGELVNASLLYCYDGVTPSISVVKANYDEFLKDDYLFGEYTNQKGEKLYIYDYKMDGVFGDYSFYSEEIYLPAPNELLAKNPIIKKDNKKVETGDHLQNDFYFGPNKVVDNKIVFDVTSICITPYFLMYYFGENNISYSFNDLIYFRYNERAVSFTK